MKVSKIKKLFYPGHTACAGCPETIAIKNMLDVAGRKTIIAIATGCAEITMTAYPTTAFGCHVMHVAFENAAAVASGVEAALKKLGKKDANVIALAGDGGTADIGFQSLSGMLERGHKVLFVCIDNAAYMNTGIQRSSSTPYGAWTTTSPSGRFSIGNKTWRKPIVEIIATHHIPYAATASIGFLEDYRKKLRKALMKKNQPSFLHVDCPCPVGWRFDSSQTIKIARLAVETGMWVLYEIENGKLKINLKPKGKPVKDYLKLQGRFKHLKSRDIRKIQNKIDHDWEHYKRLQKMGARI